MKTYLSKKMALIMALVLIIPMFWNQGIVVAEAATTPTFKNSKVTIVGADETYQMEILNPVAKSKYKWTSSRSSVATVNSDGLITSRGTGTATIKCKITYKTKKTKTLSSKITVSIPATDININNAKEVNGAHLLTIGERFDFNNDVIPAGTSDQVYWSVGGGDAACITINDAANGIVTGVKAGKVILKATAAIDSTAASTKNSIVNDAIIIEVVGQTATVNSADITNSSQLTIVFDSPVDASTVIGTNNVLSSNIEITMRKNTKNVLATDPGVLTASLSADLKTLTITAAKSFSGDYGVNITNKVLTTDKIAIEAYYKTINYVDGTGPIVLNSTVDETGMIMNINFSEAIDISALVVSNVTVTSPSGAIADNTTIATLYNKLNYVLSTDKKTLSINLSKIATSDYGKIFSVIFTGIKDLAGNASFNYTSTASLYTDSTKKPQAVLLTVTRTAYNTITATFNRAIETGGFAYVNNGSGIQGVVSTTNSKQVNYKLSELEAGYTGSIKVSLGYWNAYNTMPSDTTANTMQERYVNFTADTTSPVLLSSVFDPETSILTFTYNEEVTLAAASSVFSTTLVTVTDDITPSTNVSYTKIAYDTDLKVIKLQLTGITLVGNYTFTLEKGFVTDNFKNPSLARSVSISNASASSSELSGPYAVTQSTANLSEIYLDFAVKLDKESAETVSNYLISGVTIISAVVTKNTSETGATVRLTVADGTINVTVDRPLTIKGVKGYNGSYSAITSFTKSIALKDNAKPIFIAPLVFDTTSKNTIRMNFNEAIQGTLTVKVTQIGSTVATEYPNTVNISGNIAYINLTTIPANGTYLKVEIVSNAITDLSGNVSTLASPYFVMATY
ncbi:MAG: hypothetical protein WBI07_08930 [Mobilitalea sp.]